MTGPVLRAEVEDSMRLLALFFLLCPLAALAEREFHAVGVYQGYEETDGQLHGPRARVLVDRPGADVTLVLLSYAPIRWWVETTPGTRIETIQLGGHQPERSEVRLDGIPFPEITRRRELRSVHQPHGSGFRRLTRAGTGLGFDGLSSFSGDYTARPEGYILDRVDPADPALRPDALAGRVAMRGSVPPAFRPWIDLGDEDPIAGVRFGDDGFRITSETGAVRHVPITLDVPVVSWPVPRAAHDPRRGILWGASSGGDGVLYRYDTRAETWSATSLEGRDVHSLIHDSGRDRPIFATGGVQPDLIVTRDPSGAEQSVAIDPETLPGYTDLYDYGNGRPPRLVLLAATETEVLARARSDIRMTDPLAAPAFRMWTIHLRSGRARLVAYDGPFKRAAD